ncbi:DUF6760 family protein [Actinophytocola oryzae]|uniref:DUF6760 family protein n=1 Tax=Actinophytocola oryzae TaxID=502181 RepID=UPI003C7DB86C
MPVVRHGVRGGPGGWPPGGIETYAPERLREEVAYVAYHFHWPRAEILDLPHQERRQWVGEIANLNARANEGR